MLSCSNTTNGVSEIYYIRDLFATNKTVPGAVQFSIGSILNPWSTYPFGPITYNLIYTDSGNSYVTQTCSGISQTTTTLNSLVSFGITFFSFISFSSTSKNGWFKITDPLPSSGGQLYVSSFLLRSPGRVELACPSLLLHLPLLSFFSTLPC